MLIVNFANFAKSQSILVVFNSCRWNLSYKCVRCVNSQGLSTVSTRMQNHITLLQSDYLDSERTSFYTKLLMVAFDETVESLDKT